MFIIIAQQPEGLVTGVLEGADHPRKKERGHIRVQGEWLRVVQGAGDREEGGYS